MKKPLCILTIAGSDSGAGAGIQADARVIQACGGFALTALTAVTAQNGGGVTAWRPVAPGLIAAQMAAAFEGFSVAAVKTGLLPGAAAIRAVARALRAAPRLPLVVDPVIGATTGTRFLPAAGLRALQEELMPRATLLTPNWAEAEALTGQRVGSPGEAEAAARLLVAAGARAVLVKGGHGRGPVCRDVLVTAAGRVRWFEGPRIPTRNAHGTGCVLSAAIAAGLGRGEKLEAAIEGARLFLRRQLRAGRTQRWRLGAGPAFSGL